MKYTLEFCNCIISDLIQIRFIIIMRRSFTKALKNANEHRQELPHTKTRISYFSARSSRADAESISANAYKFRYNARRKRRIKSLFYTACPRETLKN